MRNRMGGAAMITAATFLAFYAMPTQKKEMVQEVNPHVIENQVSNLLTGDTSVPTNQYLLR